MQSVWIWFLIGLAAAAALYFWYASIIARRNKVREALASVDVHLTQRHDLVPNIVRLARVFMEHERGLIEEVTRLRSAVAAPMGASAEEVRQRFALEGTLAARTGQILLTMEAYPQLKSDTTVLKAQRTWTETEAQIAAARRFYNAAVNRLNTAIQIFPGNLLAGMAGVTPMPSFEASAEARTAPDVDAILGRAGG